jgi:type I restriction enzyme M protein
MSRISQQQLESYLWDAATLLRGTIDAGDYKQFIFPLLFYKRLCDVYDEETRIALAESDGDKEFALFRENHRFQIPPEAHWRETRKVAKNVGTALQSAMRAIETANPDKLYGIFGDAQWTNKDRLPDAMLRDLIEHFSSLELTIANLPEDELGNGYEYLIKKFADDAGHTAAEFYTNRTVVHLMTELLQPQPGESVYDPTCGSGGMPLSCVAHLRRQGKEWRNVCIYGQERNLMTSSIARMNCFLHGIEDFRIERGDTLAEPKFVQGDRLQQFDVVLANPPYSIKQWDREAFASDPWGRNIFGTPPQGRADYAFWQHIIRSMNPQTGRCAILFPHGVLFRQEEAEMRRKLIEADLIECIIGLGPNLFYNSPMEACVVICRALKPEGRRNKILFINAVNEVTRERAQSFLTDEHIGRIVNAYERYEDEPTFTCVAPLDTIRARDGVLSIPLYVAINNNSHGCATHQSPPLAVSIDNLLFSHNIVTGSLVKILPDIALSTQDEVLNGIEQSELLAHSGWVHVHLGDVVENLNETSDPGKDCIERFIGLEHLEPSSLHVRSWGSVSDGTTFTRRCRPGQVLFGKRRAYQRKVAVAEFDAVVSGDIYVLAPKGSRLLPELLPFICMSERFFQFAVETSAGSLSPRTNWGHLSKFEFDMPPLDQQRRIADILWSVDGAILGNQSLSEALLEYRQSFLDSVAQEYSVSHSLALLESIIEQGRPICYGILMPGTGVPNGIPVVKVRDYPYGQIQETDLLLTTPEIEAPYKRSRLKSGDLLLSIRGTIGRVAEVPTSLEGANITQDTARLSITPDHNRYFIRSMLESRFLQSQIQSRITGLAVKGINIGEVRKLKLPLPPRWKQDEIAHQLETLAQAQQEILLHGKNQRALIHNMLETMIGGSKQ